MIDKPKRMTLVIYPSRSLELGGLIWLFSILAIFSTIISILFIVIGAWPISVFLAFDIILLWFALRKNYISADIYEEIELSGNELIVRRFKSSDQIESIILIKNFTTVEIFHDPDRQLVGTLFLKNFARKIEIGSFLGPDERLRLANTLTYEFLL